MKCPLCGSEQGHRIYRLCDNMKIMGSSFPQSPAYVSVCEECGLVYTDMEATQDDLLSYYKNGAVAPNYYDMFGKEETEKYYEHLLDLIKPYINEKSRILDIAGAWGELASYLKRRGYEDVTVLDPNEKCISSAEASGLKTISTDSTAMHEIDENSYDMVILNHALEHILDVNGTMHNISRILRDEGALFIEIPNVVGYPDEQAAPFNFLTYEHVLHMSMNDMENLAGEYGFEILEKGDYYKKVSNYPSIYAILKKAGSKQLTYSDASEKAIKRYIEKSKEDLKDFIEPLRQSKEPLVLWGIGASTAILLEAFEGCNVKMLIDKNPNRQGLKFKINGNDHIVEPPQNVREGTIVILSIPYCESIRKQIREMGFQNKIIALKKEVGQK